MTEERRANPSAIYVLLTAVVLVVAVVIGLKLAAERRGPSPQVTVLETPLPMPTATPVPTPAANVAPGTPAAAAAPTPPRPPAPRPNPAAEHPVVYGAVRNDRDQVLAQAHVSLLPRQAVVPSPHLQVLSDTRTDAEGQYLLAAPGPGEYTVVADAFGFTPMAENRVVFAGTNETVEVNFTLTAGSLIAGQVRGTANDPVEGALVVACESPALTLRKRPARLLSVPRAFEPKLKYPTVDGGSVEVAAALEESPFRAATDSNGYYQILGLPAGYYTVKAAHTGLAPAFQLAVEAGRRGVDFQLSQGGSVSGSVANRNGQPVSSAPMTLLFKMWLPAGVVRGQEAFRLGYSENLHAQSGAAGSYVFDRLPPGEYDLTVKAPGYLEATQPVDLTADQQRKDVNFVLDVESVVSGKLSDSDGKPLSGGNVLATRVEPGAGDIMPQGPEQQGRSDEQGNYRIDNLPAGQYWIAASLPGYQCEDRKQISVEAGSNVAGIDFVLTHRASISGAVVDVAGNAVAGAVVRMGSKETEATMERALEIMADQGEIEQMETRVDADGRFTLGNLKSRSYDIEVFAAGYETQTLSLPAGMQDARIELKKKEK